MRIANQPLVEWIAWTKRAVVAAAPAERRRYPRWLQGVCDQYGNFDPNCVHTFGIEPRLLAEHIVTLVAQSEVATDASYGDIGQAALVALCDIATAVASCPRIQSINNLTVAPTTSHPPKPTQKRNRAYSFVELRAMRRFAWLQRGWWV